ncbi:hypothetical protein HK105_207321 [Polyrhizophydium stewartii]|uniref:Uncharacterized protein n=1 Tax=Polyrhizophydium stewartii TaxID=2732419 RepID=A0ABR4N116_9FUNG
MLGPWNTWITAAPYFQTRLAGSPFATSFQSYIAIAFMATNLTSLLAMLRFQHKIDTSARVVGGFVLSAAVFLLAAWMPQWTSLDASAYFGISLVLIAASSVSSALLGGLIGYASAFPPVFVAAISSGQGMAGVVPSVSQLLLLGMSPTGEGTGGPQRATPRFSAIMQAYFSISVVISVVSLGGFVYLLRGGAGRGASRHDADERRGGDAAPDRARGFSSRSRLRSVEDSEEAAAPILSLPSDDDEDDGAPSATRLDVDLAGDDEAAADARGTVTLGQILPAVRPCAAAMVLNFAITLGVFPTLTSFVQSTGQLSGVIAPGLFVPVHFLVFNVADLAGKSLPLIPRLASFAPATLLRATAWRLVFFPLLALCNITVADRSGAALPRVLPLVFGDAAYLAILALLGLTGGWLGTLLFIAGPAAAGHGRGAARAAAVRLGGDVMVVALAIGLLAGSAASFGLRGLVCGCNPFVS